MQIVFGVAEYSEGLAAFYYEDVIRKLLGL
jgi:hypothetical protein